MAERMKSTVSILRKTDTTDKVKEIAKFLDNLHENKSSDSEKKQQLREKFILVGLVFDEKQLFLFIILLWKKNHSDNLRLQNQKVHRNLHKKDTTMSGETYNKLSKIFREQPLEQRIRNAEQNLIRFKAIVDNSKGDGLLAANMRDYSMMQANSIFKMKNMKK